MTAVTVPQQHSPAAQMTGEDVLVFIAQGTAGTVGEEFFESLVEHLARAFGADVGFVAEEVNAVEPLLTVYNDKGEIEGVKYAQVTTALVNAVKEQQTQIEKQNEQIEKQNEQLRQQQAQIDALKALVCQSNTNAPVCPK